MTNKGKYGRVLDERNTMIAEVERRDGGYERIEMGDPKCGVFCDTCGDCLRCSLGCWCGWDRWVIYTDDPLNPYKEEFTK